MATSSSTSTVQQSVVSVFQGDTLLDAEPLQTLLPFEYTQLELPQGNLRFIDTGTDSDQSLLFVHGNPTWSLHWRGFLSALGGRYRCVSVDHMGCGFSDKPQQVIRLQDHIDHLASLVEHLGLRNITLVAQDWGGAIGLGTLLRTPGIFSRIVLFNTGAFPPWYIPWRISVCRWPVVGRLAVQGANAFARAALRMTLSRRDQLDPELAAAYVAPYPDYASRRQIYEFVADIPMRKSHPTWQTLADIEAGLPRLSSKPSLLVWGMRDWCFRPDCLDRFVSYWPEAEVHRLADVGHWVVEDAPEQSLEIVESFLKSTGG